MSRTRLFVECPNCHLHYLIKDFGLRYSNGAYIEDVSHNPEWQILICPCSPRNPYKFKLKEKTRLYIFSDDEPDRTHFSLEAVRDSKAFSTTMSSGT